MKIKVSEIRKQLIESEFSEDWAAFDSKIKMDIRILEPVTGNYRLVAIDENVLLRMNFHAVLELHCSRCLTPFSRPCDKQIEMLLYPDSLQPEMLELDLESPDIGFFGGDIINISDYIGEEILLNIPMKPLCGENCHGLCPVCGIDLNKSSCQCMPKTIDPRWQDLQKLKSKLSTEK